jgi:hypothetical protein
MEDLGVGGKYYKLGLQQVRWGDMDCIGVPEDKKRWLALSNALMNFRVP